MKRGGCPRLFEVEALRNGRLSGAERSSFERHLGVCDECSREDRALEALGEALRAGANDAAGTDELHVRRERTRLLAAFDRSLIAPESSPSRRRQLLWPAFAVLVAGLLIFWRMRSLAPLESPTAASDSVLLAPAIIHADATALWSKRQERGREIVVLERGSLHIQVQHPGGAATDGARRLLVLLPDGELEDLGTTFTVVAEGGRTTRVAVEEGSVLLRLRGRSPLAIEAGRSWTPLPSPATPELASSAPSAAPSASAPSTAQASKTILPEASAHQPPPSDPSEDFRRALAALNAGEPRTAAAKFARFLERYPRDARAEDAAYLRVLALRKAGDSSGMKRAGESYLRRYPAGFRRTEVEQLLQ